MSDKEAQALKETALAIYLEFAAELGHEHWDWNPVATTAINAAQAFDTVWSERFEPQKSVPSDSTAFQSAPLTPEQIATATGAQQSQSL